ncbi:Bax inhibitor-1/YccA family protein [Desulfovibrio sp. OttesenSCG-928-F07]|nr:Bax inhibitor-1/YccA family protein [Desulfovibrio sp. OttesenSCG-928-F07]
MSQNYQTSTGSVVNASAITNKFLQGVYGWMAVGLLFTALTSLFVASSPTILSIIFGQGILVPAVLMIAQFGIVIAISAALPRLSHNMVTGLFIAYSALTGLTLSVVWLVYPLDIVLKAFISASATFAAMSIYGLVTKRDLTSMGSFMTVGLFGIIIAMLVNFFFKSPALDYAICFIGVIVFLGLTAYDTQKLRNMGLNAPHDDALAMRRGTIFGALTLYLDFINLFLFLLRIFGASRD